MISQKKVDKSVLPERKHKEKANDSLKRATTSFLWEIVDKSYTQKIGGKVKQG